MDVNKNPDDAYLNSNNNNVRAKPSVPSKPSHLKVSSGRPNTARLAAGHVTPRSWQPQKFTFSHESQDNVNRPRGESESKFSAQAWRPVPRVVQKETAPVGRKSVGRGSPERSGVKYQDSTQHTQEQHIEEHTEVQSKQFTGRGTKHFKTHSKSLCSEEEAKGFGSLKRMWSHKTRNVNDHHNLPDKLNANALNGNTKTDQDNHYSLSRSTSSSSSCSVHMGSFKRKDTTYHYVAVTSPTSSLPRNEQSGHGKKFDSSLQSPRPFRTFSIEEETHPLQSPRNFPSANYRTKGVLERSQNVSEIRDGNSKKVSVIGVSENDDQFSDEMYQALHSYRISSPDDTNDPEHQGRTSAELQRIQAVKLEGVTVNESSTDTQQNGQDLPKAFRRPEDQPPPLLPREKMPSSHSSVVPPVGVYGANDWGRNPAPYPSRYRSGSAEMTQIGVYGGGYQPYQSRDRHKSSEFRSDVSPGSTVPPPLLPRGVAPTQDYTPMSGSEASLRDKTSLGSMGSLNSPPFEITDTPYTPMEPYEYEKHQSADYSTAVDPPALKRQVSVREYHEIDPDPNTPIGMTSPILETGSVPPPPNVEPPTLPSGAKSRSGATSPKAPASPPPLPPMNTSDKKTVKRLNYIEVEVGSGDGSAPKPSSKRHSKTNYTEVMVGTHIKDSGDPKKGKSVKGKILSMFASKQHDGYSSDGDIIDSHTKGNVHSEDQTTDFSKERNKLKRISGRFLGRKKAKAKEDAARRSAELNSLNANLSASRDSSDVPVAVYSSTTNLSTASSGSSRSLSHITSTSNSATSSGDGQAGSLEKRQIANEDANGFQTVPGKSNHKDASRRQSYEPNLTSHPPSLSEKSYSEQQLNTVANGMNHPKTHLQPQEAPQAYSRSAESTPNHGYQTRSGAGGSPAISAPRVRSHLHQQGSPRPFSEPTSPAMGAHQRRDALQRPHSTFDSDGGRAPLPPPHGLPNSPGMVRVLPLSLKGQSAPKPGEAANQEQLSPNFPTESPPAPPSAGPTPYRPVRFSQKTVQRYPSVEPPVGESPPTPMRDLKPDRFRKRTVKEQLSTDDTYTHAQDVPEINVDEEMKIQAENSGHPVYDIVPHDLVSSPSSKSKLLESEPLYQVYRSRTLSHASMKVRSSQPNQRRRVKTAVNSPRPTPNSNSKHLSYTSQWQSDLMTDDMGTNTLWREVPEVVKSGVGKDLTNDQMKLQQAQFEVVTSQASYMRSLNILTNHFMRDWAMESTDVLPKVKRKQLFSNIEAVGEVEQRFLQEIEQHFWDKLFLTDIAKITAKYARADFEVYVRYVQNQVYQDRVLTDLQRNNDKFSIELTRLESSPYCNKLPLLSFLLLPMQRVTRLPLLISAIVNKADAAGEKEAYTAAKQALAIVNKLVKRCNEGARKMQQTEQLAEIASELAFAPKVKTYALVSQSRALVKKGEMQVTIMQDNKKAKVTKFFLFLFTDVLLLARKRSFLEAGSNLKYEVMDWAKRAMLFVNESAVSDNDIFLVMLENCFGKRVEMTLMPTSQNERSRWATALNPGKAEESGDSIYESWDCPQYQCVIPYTAQQPDELTLDAYDVIKVLRKTTDGWLEGERMGDNEVGWCPIQNCVEIEDEHVRARNLRNLYRIIPPGTEVP